MNVKPRPIVLEYLGKADDLLKRLQGLSEYKLKSYSHGHIAPLLELCKKLDICSIINKHAGTVIQNSGSRGRPKVQYSLESADGYALLFIKLFRLDEMLKKRPKIKGLSKY